MGLRITQARYALCNSPAAAAQLRDCCWGARPFAHRMASRRDREALMGSMEEFIRYANLIIVKRQLADPSITDEQRRMFAGLLALEEAKRFHEKDDGHAER